MTQKDGKANNPRNSDENDGDAKEQERLRQIYSAKLSGLFPETMPVAYDSLNLINSICLMALLPYTHNNLIPSYNWMERYGRVMPLNFDLGSVYYHLQNQKILIPAVPRKVRKLDLDESAEELANSLPNKINIRNHGGQLMSAKALHEELDAFMRGVSPETPVHVSAAEFRGLIQIITIIELSESINCVDTYVRALDIVPPGNMLGDTLRELQTTMSVAELAPFIKMAMRGAFEFYSSGKASSRTHAANTVPKSLRRSVKYYQLKGWNAGKWPHPDPEEPMTLPDVVYSLLLKNSCRSYYQSINDIIDSILDSGYIVPEQYTFKPTV
ncbi:hypothetical protein [Vibrio mediterranei]|uniref:hypothetical protein n=1 Tax=Vibrio mediterranei TaxID=689 RepID=UPI0040695E3A